MFKNKAGYLLALLLMILVACSPGTPDVDPADEVEAPSGEETSTENEGSEGQTDETETEASDSGENAVAEETERQGGTLIAALGSDPEHLNTSISSSVTVGLPAGAITEGLIRIDRDYNALPVLATSWDISEDGLEYTFHLREGVTWHDGEPFTSADVKFTIEEISPLHGRAGAVIENIQSIETPDDHTIVFTLDEPFSPFLTFISSENVGIQPKHIYEGTDILENPANLAPIGTGPFKFESWTAGDSIVMVRNEEYWDAPAPYLDRLIFRIIPDNNARILALEAGEVDYISNYDISFVDVDQLLENPEITVELDRGHPRVLLLFFNMENAPLDVPEVRHALFMALDRDLMLESAFGGIGSLGRSSIPPGLSWAYNPEVDYVEMYPYDPAAAEALLDEAGFPRGDDGTRMELRFLFDSAQPGFSDVADILRSNWEAIGVNVTLEPRERAVWLDQLYTQKDYDTSIAFYTTSGDPVLGVQRAYLCEEIRPASFTNASQYCNPELDELFAQATSAVTQEERAEYYYEAQEIIARDLPTTVLIDSGFADAVRSNFGGLETFFQSPETTTPRWDAIYLNE